MNLLLDTHIAIWAVEDSPRLSALARKLILDPDAVLHVSVASLWEIAIKHALNRGSAAMPMSAKQAAGFFQVSGFHLVPVSVAHALAVETLPPHHDDPFDRLIVATALSEPLRLVSHDARLAAYGGAVDLV